MFFQAFPAFRSGSSTASSVCMDMAPATWEGALPGDSHLGGSRIGPCSSQAARMHKRFICC